MAIFTNRVVCNYFADKHHYQLSNNLFTLLPVTENDNYIRVYDELCKQKGFEYAYCKSLYRAIKAWEEATICIYDTHGNMTESYITTSPELSDKLAFLSTVSDLDFFNPIYGNTNQKWHLYISYFALKVLWNWESPSNFWDDRWRPSDKHLNLWLIENVENQEFQKRYVINSLKPRIDKCVQLKTSLNSGLASEADLKEFNTLYRELMSDVSKKPNISDGHLSINDVFHHLREHAEEYGLIEAMSAKTKQP